MVGVDCLAVCLITRLCSFARLVAIPNIAEFESASSLAVGRASESICMRSFDCTASRSDIIALLAYYIVNNI